MKNKEHIPVSSQSFRGWGVELCILGAIFAFLGGLYFPIFYNAEFQLNPDEVFHANEIIAWFKGGPFFLYYEKVYYHGIVGGLSAVPFFWVMGIKALAYKIVALIYYSLYVWTLYRLARYISPQVGRITLFLLLIPAVHLSEIATMNVPFALIGFLGNLILLRFLKIKMSSEVTRKDVFLLFAFIGFAIYSFNYSILYIFLVLALAILTHPLCGVVRGKISLSLIRDKFRSLSSGKMKVVRILDAVIVLFIPIIAFSYVFGGFGFDVGGVSILQSNKLHKPVSQFLVVVVIRLLIHRSDVLIFWGYLKDLMSRFDAATRRLVGTGILGFVVGISPRIVSIVRGEITRGGEGFDIDFSPVNMARNFWKLVSVVFPEISDVIHPALDLLMGSWADQLGVVLGTVGLILLSLYCAAAISFYSSLWPQVKKLIKFEYQEFDVRLYFILFPLLLCTAVVISNSGPVPGYMYPLNGMASVWIAIFLNKIFQRSVPLFALLLCLWAGFYLHAHQSYYTGKLLMEGVMPVKAAEPLYDVIAFLKEKNIEVAYAAYGIAPKATFLSDGSLLVNEHYRASRGKKMRERTASTFPFATIASDNMEEKVYEEFLVNNGIVYQKNRFNEYIVFWDFEGDRGIINQLRSLFD